MPDLDPDQARDSTAHAPGGKQPTGIACVVARVDEHVQHFFQRIPASLACLQLEEVEDLLAPTQHDVVEAKDGCRSLADAGERPGALRAARGGEGLGDIRAFGLREGRDDLARERSPDFDHPVTTISTRWNSLRSL